MAAATMTMPSGQGHGHVHSTNIDGGGAGGEANLVSPSDESDQDKLQSQPKPKPQQQSQQQPVQSHVNGNVSADANGQPSQPQPVTPASASASAPAPAPASPTTSSSSPTTTTTTVAAKQSRFRRLSRPLSRAKSPREKASCEFYNEDVELAEGELPSLKGKVPPRGIVRQNSYNSNGNSMSMSMESDPTMMEDAHMKTRPVTPSPRDRGRDGNRQGRQRSATPVQSNKKEKKRAGSGIGKNIMGRLSRKKSRDGKDRSRDGDEDGDQEFVTYKAPRLSPESKQKHRVFWTQLDLDDEEDDDDDPEEEEYEEDNGNGRTRGRGRTTTTTTTTGSQGQGQAYNQSHHSETEDELPDDELADRRRTQRYRDAQKRIQRQEEITERDGGGNDDDNSEDHGGGIYSIISDICSDCTWMGNKLSGGAIGSGSGSGSGNGTSNAVKNTMSMSSMGGSSTGIGSRSSRGRARPYVRSVRSGDSSLYSAATSGTYTTSGTNGYVDTPTPRFDFEKTPAMVDEDEDDEHDGDGDGNEHEDEDDASSYNDYSRNTNDNDSYYTATTNPNDTRTVGSGAESYASLTSIQRVNLRSTKAYENTAIEVEYVSSANDDHDDHDRNRSMPNGNGHGDEGSFLQLDLSGEVSSFVKRDDVRSEGGAGAGAGGGGIHTYGNGQGQRHLTQNRGGYLMSRTQSWSAPDKNAYLQAMAKKAKEDFRKKKGLQENAELQGAVERGIQSAASASSAASAHGALDDSRSMDQQEQGREQEQEEEHNHHDMNGDDGGNGNGDDDTLDGLMNEMKEKGASASTIEMDASMAANLNVNVNVNAADDMSASASTSNIPRSRSFSHVATPRSAFDGESASTGAPKTKGGGGELESPTGVADFPNIDLYKSDTASDVGMGTMRNQNRSVIGLKKVKSDLPTSKRGRILSTFRKKGGFDRVDGSNNHNRNNTKDQSHSQSSHNSSMDSAYEIRSSASILSFQRRKKKWNRLCDEDTSTTTDKHDVSMLSGMSANSELPIPPSGSLNADADTPRPGDDIFDFDENTNDGDNGDGDGDRDGARTPMTSVKLDPYEDSCDVSILGSTIGPGDDGSLYSSRSALTYGTNFTLSSVSTRHRHRGAAKKRVPADQEYQNGRPSGWLESIKAAADSNNRKWDPKRGWIDYVPPPDPVEEDFSPIGYLKSPVRKKEPSKKKKKVGEDHGVDADDRSRVSEASNVPFPPEWETERESMVRSIRDDYSTAGASAVTEVVSNKKKAKEIEPPPEEDSPPPMEIDTSRNTDPQEFELGAYETIEEGDSEEEPVLDNNEAASSNIDTGRLSMDSLPSPNFVQPTFVPVETPKIEHEDEDDNGVADENRFEKDVGTDWIEEESVEDNDGENNDASLSLSITSDDVMGRTKPLPDPRERATEASSPLPKTRSESPKSLVSLTSSAHVSVENEGYVQFSPYAGKTADDNASKEAKKNGSFDDGQDDFGGNGSFDFSATDSNHADDSDDGFKIVNERKDGEQQSSSKSVTLSPSARDTVIRKRPNFSLSPSRRDTASQRKQASDAGSVESKNASICLSSLSSIKKPVPSSPANSMSSRAKDWLKKVEQHKQKNGKKSTSNSNPSTNNDDPVSALFVSAADDTSTFEYGPRRTTSDNDNDTLFEFEEEKKSKGYVRKNGEVSAPHFKTPAPEPEPEPARSLIGSDYQNTNDSMSEITGPSRDSASLRQNPRKKTSRSSRPQSETFLSRLQSCTAPMMDDGQEGENMPQAHLEFLRKAAKDTTKCTTPPEFRKQGQGFIDLIQSQTLCGSMESISSGNIGLPPRPPSSTGSGTKGRSSIASSYLQAIKEKANGCGTNADQTGGIPSVASTDSSKSESWQKFLEKRNKALETTSKRSSGSRSSKAAEQYASRKLEEIMSNISSRAAAARGDSTMSSGDDGLQPPSRSQSRPRNGSRGRAPRHGKSSALSRDDAARAAEDLAAARVEAMMAMTSGASLEECEI